MMKGLVIGWLTFRRAGGVYYYFACRHGRGSHC